MSFRLSFNTVSLVVILASFVFLLLACISSPVVKSFYLGHTASHTYGVFGYCSNNNQDCYTGYPIRLSSVHDDSTNWILSNSSRDTLAKIFILTPIALGFNFILLVLIVASHFGSRPVVLIGIAVNVISLILTIISCVVSILAYYPNLGWTGWILIGSAAANIISLIALILTLTVSNGDDDDSGSTFDNEDFGRFTNYNRIDDKFNHIQTSTFKTNSSLDDEFDYKPKESANTGGFTVYNNNNAGQVRTAANNGPSGAASAAVGAASAAVAGATVASASGPGSGRVVLPADRMANHGSLTSNSSSYFNKPQTANDFTQRDTYGYQPSPPPNTSTSAPGSAGTASGLPYPAGTPTTTTNDKNEYDSSVFEHHPEVEGHKPFTELDDDSDDADEEDVLVNNNRQAGGNGINDSDEDSDFTSVSQRAPNPQYYGSAYGQGYQPQQSQYAHVQQYAPMHQQQQFQQQQQQQPNPYRPMPPQQQYAPGPAYAGSNVSAPGSSYYSSQGQPSLMPYQQQQQQQAQQQRAAPTISDNVLSNNPDFQFSRKQQPKRKVNPGFVPVAARYNGAPLGQKNQNASALMGRGGGANSGPYSITR
ncbi:pH-response regulator protein palI/RIM9 [Candida viswanathii]|uniref:pH-response regulator protein palI/RIM9 n=1 Tax=Candida viswanathii TaxID=5486 RepID=A0A367YMV7_9ASCO|nr:pH-response regulator protein palI/RIM9 [Candida viswanathii]